ncbi:expressed unknown protein [Seminavis robusta]|uniref:Uncharacterized protein n=1 Tax=Seminavis robusta TaxID=568900 RepID=A0A9N8HXZ1_9STRA|nr:expressed unknown protein [Seminavis robusta]|eukprot:Sro2347_g324280.1 n/a (580) ;mRNA; r:10630-12605
MQARAGGTNALHTIVTKGFTREQEQEQLVEMRLWRRSKHTDNHIVAKGPFSAKVQAQQNTTSSSSSEIIHPDGLATSPTTHIAKSSNTGRKTQANATDSSMQAISNHSHQENVLTNNERAHSISTNTSAAKQPKNELQPKKKETQDSSERHTSALSSENPKAPVQEKQKPQHQQQQQQQQKQKQSTISTNSTSSTGRRPSMIIHIGPSKTGTSTIQRESISLQPFLTRDNFVYIGKFAESKYRRASKAAMLLKNDGCFQEAAAAWKYNNSNFNDTECWMGRMSGIMKYYHQNISMILSDEGYSYKGRFDNHTYYQLLRVAFQDWNVVVVPTYRRYAEWLLSASKEVNRKGCLNPNAPWKHNDGKKCKDLWKMMDRDRKAEHFRAYHYRNLDASLPAWRGAGFPIALLDFHGEQHLTCSLYCNLITDTPQTCQECQKRPANQLNSQSSSLTAYNDIVFVAEEMGLLPNSTLQKSRFEATIDLAHYHGTTMGKRLGDLPLICPKQSDLEHLLNKSLAFERMVLPEKHLDLQQAHTTSFWEMAKDRKDFCSVDTTTLLEGKVSWEQVQEAMKETKEWSIQYY